MIRFSNIEEAAKRLSREFQNKLPWMYVFCTYKRDGKNILFQYLLSLPSATIVADASRKLTFWSKWHFETQNPFRTGEGDPTVDEILGKEPPEEHAKATKIEWSTIKTNQEKKKNDYAALFKGLTKAAKYKQNEKPQNFRAEAFLSLQEVNRIDMYTWGFEVDTDGPMNITAVRGKFLKDSFPDASVYYVEDGIKSMMGMDFQLPSQVMEPKYLLACWHFQDADDITDEEIDQLLDESQKEKSIVPSHLKDIGGNVNKHIQL